MGVSYGQPIGLVDSLSPESHRLTERRMGLDSRITYEGEVPTCRYDRPA